MVDWSSLPSDLVNHIADCFLATNDLDYYMDFRAVCRNWRSATDDPNNPEVRFRPRRWMAVDDGLYLNSRDSRVLANTVTGRILRKDLPLLRNYFVIAATHGGFFVLADRKPPHAVLILNPFTGHMIRFIAAVPSYSMKDVLAAVSGSAPTLILISDEICAEYRADPASECFSVYKQVDTYSVSNRLAVMGGIYADGEHGSVATIPTVVASKIYELIAMFPEPSQVPADVIVEDHPVDAQPPNTVSAGRYSLAEFAGEVFIVVNLQHQMVVFKLDNESEALVPVKSIGNLAIFIGYHSCFIVNADKFPTIDANCIYYQKSTDIFLFVDICKFDLKDQKEERVCESIHSFSPITHGFPDPPFSIVQYLANFATGVQEYEIVT
ncbi:hypothetical protein VPH35_063521 [Triticum aestivum]